MRDERGEVRGLLIVLGLVCALAAVVFGFGLRAHKSSPAAAKVAAGTTTLTVLGAPTTTAVAADPGAPAAAPVASQSAAVTPGGAPAAITAPRTPTAPVTSPPATAPPATSPSATSPAATTPPTTAPRTCTVTMGNATPKRGTALEITVTSNSVRTRVDVAVAPVTGVGKSDAFVGQTGDDGSERIRTISTPSDQPAGTSYKVKVTVSAATCSTTFTTT